MAERVVEAAGDLPVAVVTSGPEVEAWARDLGLELVADPGSLDGAAAAGVEWANSLGLGRVILAHADLPLARSLTALTGDASRPVVAVVPCHRDDGTPVLSVPTASPFTFAYGPGSFRRHAAEARRRGLGFRVIRDLTLGFDVDDPDDLVGLELLNGLPIPALACGPL
jgi:2-phospho-L-lactate guanylyltransferase